MNREDLVIGKEYKVTSRKGRTPHCFEEGTIAVFKGGYGRRGSPEMERGDGVRQYVDEKELDSLDPVEFARSNLKKAEEELKKAEAEARKFKMSDLEFPLVVEIAGSLRLILKEHNNSSTYNFYDIYGFICNTAESDAELLSELNGMYKKTTRTFSVSN